MNAKTNSLRLIAAVAIAAVLATWQAHAQTIDPSKEGYDPMRQISTQFVRPNILIVQDVTGSMAWDIYANSVGADWTGNSPTAAWSSAGTNCDPNNPSNCMTWTYTLTITQTFPSRIATVKNALGNSVNITTPWFPPRAWNTDTTYAYITNANWKALGTITTGPVVTNASSTHDYAWDVTFTAFTTDPLAPFIAYDANGVPTVGSGGQSLPAQDLIGKTANQVNWGLEIFSDSNGNCTTQKLLVPIDSNDTGNVDVIEAYMKLTSQSTTIGSTTYWGLRVGGGTPTIGALTYAATVLTNTFNADPKYACGRTYAAILVTDGLSNSCNPSNLNWITPCDSTCADVQRCCDAGSSGFDCITGWKTSYTSFPPAQTEAIWNLNLTRGGSTPQNVHTWVIGVSPQVSRCELNVTAYFGRTDASSPNGDAGMNVSADPYLPTTTGDTSKYDTTHGDYAYFANTAQALSNAFASIVAAVGIGDYTSGSPSFAASPSTLATVGLVPSASYPDWNGHLWAYDMTCPLNYPPYYRTLWDAGDVLSKHNNNGFARQIYTWDPTTNTPILVNTSAPTVTQLNTLCGSCGITAAVVDFMLGNDGTLTNTKRPWLLGPIVNVTPAVIGPPEVWTMANDTDHKSFATTYQNRHPHAWVGSSDGMVHAFDIVDGAEIVAIAPPDLLGKQVTLYNTYKSKPSQFVTGQPKAPWDHVYGVGNSVRFGDVCFKSGATCTYKTVMFITEGPGGTGIHALDVTHVFPGRTGVVLPAGVPSTCPPYTACTVGSPPAPGPAPAPVLKDFPVDPNYVSPPFTPLWSRTRNGAAGTTALAGLGQTWSVPSLGMSAAQSWDLFVGAGFDASLGTPPGAPSYTGISTKAFHIDPTSGVVKPSDIYSLPGQDFGKLVRSQSFADSVALQTNAGRFLPDNFINQALQTDLNGQVWTIDGPTWTKSSTPLFNIGGGNPIYYPPATVGYPPAGASYTLYAFASGTFYEKSPNVSGSNIGTAPNFVPALYIGTKNLTTGIVSSKKIILGGLRGYVTDCATGVDTFDRNLSTQTQITSPPILATSYKAATKPFALFLAYDPLATNCVGKTYLLFVQFDPTTLAYTVSAYDVGLGAAGGFGISESEVQVSKSWVGANGQAYLKATGKKFKSGSPEAPISWWVELQ